MKKRKKLDLSLNKRKVSELSKTSQQKIIGGGTYGGGCVTEGGPASAVGQCGGPHASDPCCATNTGGC